jgi:NlpC/P60 family
MKKMMKSLVIAGALTFGSFLGIDTAVASHTTTVIENQNTIAVDSILPGGAVVMIDFSQFYDITLYAQAFQGIPYYWGGVTTRGFDCSGLMMFLYKEFGYSLPHSSVAQSRMGRSVSLDEVMPGDLMFFNTRRNGVSHVGMVVDRTDEGEIIVIHASSSRGVVLENFNRSSYLSKRYVKSVHMDLDEIRVEKPEWSQYQGEAVN